MGFQAINLLAGLLRKNCLIKSGYLVENRISDRIFRQIQKILCCGDIAGINTVIKTRRVGKPGVFHTNPSGLVVHGRNKRINIARKIDGYGECGIVA